MADKHGLLNSWLEVFSPTVMGCLTADYTTVDLAKWETWCRETANAGGNGVRILTYAPWGYPVPGSSVPIERLFCPYRLDMMTNQWDLDAWNEKWFASLVAMRDVAKLHNIKIWLSLFDNCQSGPTEGVVPWYNNKQFIRGYYNSFAYSYKFVDRVTSLLGGTINYELINEGEPKGNMALAVKWNVAMFDRLISKGIKPETICWGAMPKSIYKDGKFNQDREHDLAQQILSVTERRDREQSNKVYRAMHGVGVANEVKNGEKFPASYCGEWSLEWWGGAHSGKGFISDDGVKNGGNALDIPPGGIYKYQRPSAEQWYIVAKKFFESGKSFKWIIERLPSNIDPAVWVPTMQAISRAYHDVYGVWPENYGEFPPVVETEPVPEPEPEPLPPVVKPTFGWLGEWRNNWKWIVGIVILIVLAIAIF